MSTRSDLVSYARTVLESAELIVEFDGDLPGHALLVEADRIVSAAYQVQSRAQAIWEKENWK